MIAYEDLEIYFVAEMYYIAEVVILYVQGRGIFTEDKRWGFELDKVEGQRKQMKLRKANERRKGHKVKWVFLTWLFEVHLQYLHSHIITSNLY